jgi:nitrite transporter NirC
MNYTETCNNFANLAQKKALVAKTRPLAFLAGSMLAGAYVGIALILAWTCSAGLPPGVRPLVNGSVFGIGLVLVILAGAEMFTGHVMYMSFGLAKRTISISDALICLVSVWVGNLIGAAILAALFVNGGGGAILGAPPPYFHDLIVKKETASVIALLCRATLCNWLVCLAIWGAARISNEVGKIWFIAWCLLAFVACGFEHSVANMTAFSMGTLAGVGTLGGAFYNLGLVTVGNLIGGGVLVAGVYLMAAQGDKAA